MQCARHNSTVFYCTFRWLDDIVQRRIDAALINDVTIKRSRQHALDSGELSDVTLQCGDSEIACHRVILAESSPYFKAMFTSNMREAEDRCVELKDVAFKVLRKVVEFLYTGQIKISGDDLMEILHFADMCQIDSL